MSGFLLSFIHLMDGGKRKLVAFYLIFCDCKCSSALPNGAVGWFALFDCGIS